MFRGAPRYPGVIGEDQKRAAYGVNSLKAEQPKKNPAQGLPSQGNVGKGPLGVAQDEIAGPVAAAVYNTAIGAGSETLELGISASEVATTVAGVTAEAAASVVAFAKVEFDAAVFVTGFVKCK